jgi:hypothetical protein
MPQATKSKAKKPRHKVFEVVDLDDVDLEPLTFDLGGETFHCAPEVQGATILELMRASANADEDSRGILMAVSVLDFFELCMDEDEHKRFAEFLHNKKKIVRMTTLSEIMSWLIEEYTDRPTQQPSDS